VAGDFPYHFREMAADYTHYRERAVKTEIAALGISRRGSVSRMVEVSGMAFPRRHVGIPKNAVFWGREKGNRETLKIGFSGLLGQGSRRGGVPVVRTPRKPEEGSWRSGFPAGMTA
jgi:hypothetical protein